MMPDFAAIRRQLHEEYGITITDREFDSVGATIQTHARYADVLRVPTLLTIHKAAIRDAIIAAYLLPTMRTRVRAQALDVGLDSERIVFVIFPTNGYMSGAN